MNTLTLAVFLLSPLQASETDVVVLKDGKRIAGFIVEETDTTVVLEALIKGSKGETLGTGRRTFEKSEVAAIERTSPEARAKAKARADASRDRSKKLGEQKAKVKVTAADFEGLTGLSTAGEFCEIYSTCDESFLREVAVCLDEMFLAYRSHFKIRRTIDSKVRVYLLSNPTEYVELQKTKCGFAVANPAIYHMKENFVAAYNRIQAEEARLADEQTQQSRNQIEEYRKDVREAELRVAKQAREIRQEIENEAVRLRNEVHKENPDDKEARLRAIERWKEAQFRKLREDEKEIQAALAAQRKKAAEAIEICEKTIARNVQVLREQNRAMFETLFHEGFHAFAQNFLFAEKEIPRWINEGMACYYEMSAVEGGELIHGARHAQLLEVFRRNEANRKLLPLSEVLRGDPTLFLVTHASQVDRSNAAYAQCWAVAHYLVGRVTQEQMDEYVATVMKGKDPADALSNLLNLPLRKIEAEVGRHVSELK